MKAKKYPGESHIEKRDQKHRMKRGWKNIGENSCRQMGPTGERPVLLLIIALTMLVMFPGSVFAADAVTGKINSLYEIVLGIITAAGVIVLAWGIFEFASAYQSRDTAQQTDSLKKVVSGIIMVAAPTIINMLK